MFKNCSTTLSGFQSKKRLTNSGGADGEGDEVRDRGDRDGGAGVLHGEPEALFERQFGSGPRHHVLERLRHHEHVVDSCQRVYKLFSCGEGDNSMQR